MSNGELAGRGPRRLVLQQHVAARSSSSSGAGACASTAGRDVESVLTCIVHPQAPSRLATPLITRGLAGPVKVYECDQEQIYGPAEVARAEERLEMGVLYAPGVPSPMEGAYHNEPIVVDGLVAKTGGGGLGNPVQYIKLSKWCVLGSRKRPCAQCAPLRVPRMRGAPPRVRRQGPHAGGVQVHGRPICLEAGPCLRFQKSCLSCAPS